jgi:hypothetical protein
MRKLMLALAGLAAVAAIVSVNLWRDLHRERELNAELQAQLADARDQPAPTVRSRAALPAPTTSQAQDNQAGPLSAAERTAAAEEADQQFNARRRERQHDPESRKTAVERARMNFAFRYTGLIESLDLHAEEAEKLVGIFTDRELGMRDMAIQVEDLPDEQRLEARQNAIGELNRRRDEALAALLGDTRLQRFRDFDKERPGWAQVAEFNQMLGAPLNADQSKPLVATLLAEQKRMRDALQGKATGVGSDPAAQARQAEELLEYHRRTVAAARSYLTTSQLEVLQAMFERQEQELKQQQEQLSRGQTLFLRRMPPPVTRP